MIKKLYYLSPECSTLEMESDGTIMAVSLNPIAEDENNIEFGS